jgi:hypothetical protein
MDVTSVGPLIIIGVYFVALTISLIRWKALHRSVEKSAPWLVFIGVLFAIFVLEGGLKAVTIVLAGSLFLGLMGGMIAGPLGFILLFFLGLVLHVILLLLYAVELLL